MLHTVGSKIIGPPWISPIGSYVKQVMQYWALWLQNASNCRKYDIVSIFRAWTKFAVKGNCIWIPAFILDMGPNISKFLEPLFHGWIHACDAKVIFIFAFHIQLQKNIIGIWNNFPFFCVHDSNLSVTNFYYGQIKKKKQNVCTF